MAQVTVRALYEEGLLVGGEEMLDQVGGAKAAWVDVFEPDEASMESVAREFRLHPLAVEDCLHYPQRPKLESYGDSVFLIWIVPEGRIGDGLDMNELDAFLGQRWLVTVHREPVDAADRVASEAEAHLSRGVDWVLHALLDLTVDKVFPILDEVSDRLEALEDRMLERAERTDLGDLLEAKRMLVRIHKAIVPERDILRELVREEQLVSQEAYRYFQDVGDHLARVEDGVETYRDVASGAMDVYLSAVSNRMNEIMKQLTVVATIFMPLTLISGIYGMNVLAGMWPPSEAVWSFPLIIAGMLLIALGMGLYFRRKNWW
ncbi:MAG: magnesium/cobalt transporter CorA [Actinobacteria bacterium]|nr:MAG: magnesium/cobalt transporter CorA [Actinomycetota bacterium]